MTVCGGGLSAPFSVIMIGFMRAGVLVGRASILGGGTPVSRPKGTSSRFAPVDLALIGEPAYERGLYSNELDKESSQAILLSFSGATSGTLLGKSLRLAVTGSDGSKSLFCLSDSSIFPQSLQYCI